MQEAKLNTKYNLKWYLSIPSGFTSGLWEPYKENTDELSECETFGKARHYLKHVGSPFSNIQRLPIFFKAIKKKWNFNKILCVMRANKFLISSDYSWPKWRIRSWYWAVNILHEGQLVGSVHYRTCCVHVWEWWGREEEQKKTWFKAFDFWTFSHERPWILPEERKGIVLLCLSDIGQYQWCLPSLALV